MKQLDPIPQVKPYVPNNYLRPKAAEKMLKKASGINQTIWICGVSGAGKTSLVCDYLGRRHFDYYSAREVIPAQISLPSDSRKQKIVVIDDLYGITDTEFQKEWEQCIATMIEHEDIWLILISRSDIPRWLHTLSVKQIFYRIEEAELLMTRDQTEDYFVLCGLSPQKEIYDRIWELGLGHPLWNHVCAMELSQTENADVAINNAKNSIWRYSNTYVYDLWDADVQDAIMKLSILVSFDLEMAVYMTGNKNVNLILVKAQEVGNFLKENDGTWTIWNPVCYAMEQRMNQSYDMEYIHSLYVRAGDCQRIKGRLMDALVMYEKAADERSIAELLIQNARENPSTGHYFEMRHYYFRLSEEAIRQSVELMGAVSMLHALLMNEDESERWYQELVDYSRRQKGSLKADANNKLLFLDLSLPHRGTTDIFSILKKAGYLTLHHKARLPELSVTSNLASQMNGGKDFCEWSKKDRELANSIGKIVCLVLGKYGKGLINLALAESGFEKGEDNFEIQDLAVRGRMEAESGGKLEQCFVGSGIIARLALFTNHPDNAKSTLDGFHEVAERTQMAPMMLRNIDAMNCRIDLYLGRTAGITRWMNEAPDENQEFFVMERYRYLTKVRVYVADHRYEEAKMLLSKIEFYAQRMKRTYIAMETKLLQSILYYRMGENRWKNLFQETITQVESYHFVRLLSREGCALLPLLHKAELQWENPQFKEQVETESYYMAQVYPGYLNTETSHAAIELNGNAIKILRLQAMGKTSYEIARQLEISTATVKYHNKETYKKLGVNTMAQAINEARNRKLI